MPTAIDYAYCQADHAWVQVTYDDGHIQFVPVNEQNTRWREIEALGVSINTYVAST